MIENSSERSTIPPCLQKISDIVVILDSLGSF